MKCTLLSCYLHAKFASLADLFSKKYLISFLFQLLFCRLGNLLIELEVEGVVCPLEGVVRDILTQD